LVGFIGSHEGQTWVVKTQGMATSSSTALVVYDENAKDFGEVPQASASSSSSARHAVMNEQVDINLK
jgi:hypothetical protein